MKYYTLIALICSGLLFSQTSFQPGYYLDDESNKISGLIKNEDWSSAPDKFQFRFSEGAEAVELDRSEINEMYIEGTSHYYKWIRVDAYTDYSDTGEVVNFPSSKRFVRILASGSASLCLVKENGKDRLILINNVGQGHMLIYKKYTGEDLRVREKKDFQKVLFEELQCEKSLTIEDFLKLKYTQASILKTLEAYNTCNETETVNYNSQRTKGEFSIKVAPQLVFSNHSEVGLKYFFTAPAPPSSGGQPTTRVNQPVNFNLSSQINFAFSAEVNYALPFDNKHWALFAAPTFHYIGKESSTVPVLFDGQDTQTTATYTTGFSYLELPIGLTYSFYISKKTRSYLRIAYAFNSILSDDTSLEFSSDNVVTPDRITTEEKNSSIILGLAVQIFKNAEVFANYYFQRYVTTESKVQNNLSGSLAIGFAYKVL